ncbi:uncharacterized protein LOC116620702 [Nematostella vectensis]|uniref:uncharacterized protein LOC116620702 n=1 Tax=Nematostella vectensis TaxID=45351 RepID=UPI0013904194|nr:uncharacterized protein LOC116620702 [Nematostella vectensis]
MFDCDLLSCLPRNVRRSTQAFEVKTRNKSRQNTSAFITPTMSTNRFSFGHVFLVQSHNYVPSYFSLNEFQLVGNSIAYSESTDAPVERSPRECVDDGGDPSDHDSQSLNQWMENLDFYPTISTTRFQSSSLARQFSCNVSKMACKHSSKLECDGYFGCPEERLSHKEAGTTVSRRRRPVCIIPWKKRHSTLQRTGKKKKQQATRPPIAPTPSLADLASMDTYYSSKVDCATALTDAVETRPKPPAGAVKVMAIAEAKPTVTPLEPHQQQSQSTKTHPAMFYSYFVSKGYQYKKACAPKRRSCDGVFGCHDDTDARHKCKGKPKSKGKKK